MKKPYFLLVALVILPAFLSCAKVGGKTSTPQETNESAEQTDPVGQFELGRMYYWGQGMPQDNSEALKWFRKSAAQGNPDAQYALGRMYYLGDGVGQDYVMAYMWFNMAASRGDLQARKDRDIAAEKMTSAQIEEARKAAAELKVKNGAPR
jgi:TPR repeat protein